MYWLVVSTHLKHISKMFTLFPKYGKIKMFQTTNQMRFLFSCWKQSNSEQDWFRLHQNGHESFTYSPLFTGHSLVVPELVDQEWSKAWYNWKKCTAGCLSFIWTVFRSVPMPWNIIWAMVIQPTRLVITHLGPGQTPGNTNITEIYGCSSAEC
jgi:hypothetical protein